VNNLYFLSYYTHISCVIFSGSFFFLRGTWMMVGSNLLEHKIVRLLPHIIDTLLLLSAISLTIQIQQYPGMNAWLTVKLAALIGYIVLGMYALRRAKSRPMRVVCFIGALLCFGFIVSVALSHNPQGIFARFL